MRKFKSVIKSCSLLIFFSQINIACNANDDNMQNDNEEPQETLYDYVVAQDGSGDFTTVQEAFNAASFNSNNRIHIYVKNGIYKQVLKLDTNKNNISLIGESLDGVVLTYDNYASKINPETGIEYGTSGSSSTYIYGNSFYAYNITFENSSGPVGQALAIYIKGDKAVFNNCKFLGFQDTLYGGDCRQYFKDCYIEGSTDFIFGSSTAFFDNCQLFTKGGSAITAASTKEYINFGYVFNNCKITGISNHITTLGRPWRPYASVTFVNSQMSASIKPEGWDNWGNPDNETTARYSEYKSIGDGAYPDQRVSWMNFLSDEQVKQYTVTNVLKTTYSSSPVTDNWNPIDVIKMYNN